LTVYARGTLEAEYEIGLGQGVGPKEERGDLRTPVGMYFVVEKSTGPFAGEYRGFYGGHWIKVNYPNPYDGDRGVARNLITRAQRDQISARWARREPTEQRTPLGGASASTGGPASGSPRRTAHTCHGAASSCTTKTSPASTSACPSAPWS
jgi:hypothetical protein